MKAFKIGDKVEALGFVDGVDLIGKRGKVIVLKINRYDLGVEFDESIRGGHDCTGLGKNRHCRYGITGEFKRLGISNPNSDIIIKE